MIDISLVGEDDYEARQNEEEVDPQIATMGKVEKDCFAEVSGFLQQQGKMKGNDRHRR